MSSERPWEAGPFRNFVVTELNSRVNGLSSGINQTSLPNGLMDIKSGPRRHWIRAFSNGVNKDPITGDVDAEFNWGLILKSASTFNDRYGVSNNRQVYGYSNTNIPKFINNPKYRINVPEPGITSFTADVQKNFFITAKLNWVCHSIDQLIAITPYFLTPLTTVFVEWGWNNFNEQSLINLSSFEELKKISENHFEHYDKNVPYSNGNYEFMVGDITNFEYSLEDNIIKGFTEIRSRQMLYSGFNVRGSKSVTLQTTQDAQSPVLSFRTQCQQIMSGLVKLSSNSDIPIQTDINITAGPSIDTGDKSVDTVLNGLFSMYGNKYGTKGERVCSYVYKYPGGKKTSIPNTQDGSNQSVDLSDYYITFELMVDIFNALKNKYKDSSFLKNFYEVNVINSAVGYHSNLISTSRNVLIPNPNAPKFNGKNSLSYGLYADEKTKFVGDTIEVENGNDVESVTKTTGQEVNAALGMVENLTGTITLENYKQLQPNPDIQLSLLVQHKGKVYRNNLDFVLNQYGRSYVGSTLRGGKTAFDAAGLIKNIYINLNFIKELVVIDDNDIIDMKSFYDGVLAEINESVCDYWNLELVNNDNSKKEKATDGVGLQVADVKYAAKKETGAARPQIYTFDYGSNKSIIKKINFTTSLTNAMANQILYRSFGNTSLSTNNIIDFSNNNLYVDRIKGSYRTQNEPKNSETMLTFLSILQKYLTFDPQNPSTSYLMRVQVFGLNDEKNKDMSTTVTMTNFGAGYAGLGGLNPAIAKLQQPTITDTAYKKWNIVDLYIPEKEALVYLLNDNNKKGNPNVYCAPIRNVELEIALMGIAGIRVFEYFKVNNLPPPFDKNIVFQVRDVNHTVDENGWETRIKASLRPSFNIENI